MKKILLVIAALLTFSFAGAQNFEIVGGPSLSYIKYPTLNSAFNRQIGGKSKIMPKFHFGVNAIIPLAEDIREETSFYSSVGLIFAGKGYEINKPYEDDLPLYTTFYQKGYGYSLDCPVHIGYNFQVADNFAIFVEAGATGSLGLFGKWKIQYTYKEQFTESGRGNYYDYTSANKCGFKRMDVALGGKIGVLINNRISLGVNADFGILTLADYPRQARSRNYWLSVGYRF